MKVQVVAASGMSLTLAAVTLAAVYIAVTLAAVALHIHKVCVCAAPSHVMYMYIVRRFHS